MTRRDQTLRAWIERDSPHQPWKSCVSYAGKVHQKSTGSRIRKAARQFNILHLTSILRPQAATAEQSPHPEPSLPFAS